MVQTMISYPYVVRDLVRLKYLQWKIVHLETRFITC